MATHLEQQTDRTCLSADDSEGGHGSDLSQDVERLDVIARRRSCEAEGTGLSHYILIEDKSEPR